jgi:phage tail-like protein
MDVQGSQYHLIHGEDDWSRCADSEAGLALKALWYDEPEGLPSETGTALEYDSKLGALRLRRDTPLFRRAGRMPSLPQRSRRGAGRDGYGNWYWIAEERTSIGWRPAGGQVSATWWAVSDPLRTCAGSGPGFVTCKAGMRTGMTLQGLTVTSRHYLLAGYLYPGTPSDPGESGLLVFDLQAGGEPLRMPWPAGSGFQPWDLADTPDGGALVLDRSNATYWRLDAHLRVRGLQTNSPALFQPADGGTIEMINGPSQPIGTPVASPSLHSPIDPVSIEPGPDGGVLILDSDSIRGYSLVHLFAGDELVWSVSLADAVEVIEPSDPTDTPHRYSVLGYDFVYTTGPLSTKPGSPALLYIADSEGKQVIAFELETVEVGASVEHTVVARPDFLPLRRWDGKALVRAGAGVWYDFDDEWIQVAVFTECRFRSHATLTTAIGFTDLLEADPSGTGVPTPAGSPFDSQLPGCVWHRLFLDAEIPNGTSVSVRARASDDPDLLPLAQWLPQPVPYQRSDGPELPWYDPWADLRETDGLRNTDGQLPDHTGTWELLFQQVAGRYLELELTLQGNGRSTPLLRSVRAWYPRFSYATNYLPAIYPASDSPDAFLDRFLANFEGFYTATEERIEHSALLLDARSTLAADLPWLARWFGLTLDPQWSVVQQRFLVRNIDRFYRLRGTVPGLVSTLRIYLNATPDDSVFCCASGDAGAVRVVERFLTRDISTAGSGPAVSPAAGAAEYARVAAAAHRFDVLVPADMTATDQAMVQKIVDTTKPAHTWFDVRKYYQLFVIGQARLGKDTELGNPPAYVPMVTGSDYLAAGYLGYPRPFDLADRIVTDRDRVGGLPAL